MYLWDFLYLNYTNLFGEVYIYIIYAPVKEEIANWRLEFIVKRRIIPRIYTCLFWLFILSHNCSPLYYTWYYWTTSKCRCRPLVTTHSGLGWILTGYTLIYILILHLLHIFVQVYLCLVVLWREGADDAGTYRELHFMLRSVADTVSFRVIYIFPI